MRRQGWVVWVTGLPGSGKSVTAKALQSALLERYVPAEILSSDELRKHVTPRPTYSQEERDILYDSLGFAASLLARNGVNVIIDATGNLRKYRDGCRAMLPRFAEVYVRCPLDLCMKREEARVDSSYAPRGIYEGALREKAPTVPGLGAPYEAPLKPEVTVDSDKMPPDECAHAVLNRLRDFLLA